MERGHPLAVLLDPHGRRPRRARDRLAVVGALARPLIGMDRGGRARPLELALAQIPGRYLHLFGDGGEVFDQIGDWRPSDPRVDRPSIGGDHTSESREVAFSYRVVRGTFVGDDGF